MDTTIPRLRLLSLVLLSGGVLGAGYWPGPWGIFAWVAYVPLFWVIQDASPRGALLWGTAFGGAAFAAATPWLYDVVQRWLDFPAPARALCFAMFCVYHGLRVGLACSAAKWLAELWHDRRGADPAEATAAAMVPALVAAEGFFPMMFPGLLADTQFFHLPTIQLVETTGTAGLAWLIVVCNAAVYLGLRSRRHLGMLACVLSLLAANEAWGRWRMSRIDAQASLRIAQGHSLRVGLVQGSLPHDKDYLRFSHERELHAHNLAAYNRLSRSALGSGPLDLLVWPGNILPDTLDYESADEFAPRLQGQPLAGFLRGQVSSRVPMMFYTIGRDRGQTQRWIVVLSGASQEPLGVAEKMVLTPFGDYTPGGRWVPLLRRLNPNTRAMSWGARQRALQLPGRARIAVLICYEDLLAGYAREFVRMGSDIFVDVAGNSWDDTTMLPRQHMRFAALRAVENRRYLLRGTISGISAVVDPVGRVVRSLGARQEGAIAETVALMDGRPLSVTVGRSLYGLAVLALAALGLWCLVPPKRSA